MKTKRLAKIALLVQRAEAHGKLSLRASERRQVRKSMRWVAGEKPAQVSKPKPTVFDRMREMMDKLRPRR